MSKGWRLRKTGRNETICEAEPSSPTPTPLCRPAQTLSQRGDRKWRSGVKREEIHYFSDPPLAGVRLCVIYRTREEGEAQRSRAEAGRGTALGPS